MSTAGNITKRADVPCGKVYLFLFIRLPYHKFTAVEIISAVKQSTSAVIYLNGITDLTLRFIFNLFLHLADIDISAL